MTNPGTAGADSSSSPHRARATRSRHRGAGLSLVLLLLGLATGPTFARQDSPCQNDPQRRALDFLIGRWDAVGAGGTIEGHVVVERALGGCLLIETSNALPGGAEAIGYWHFDPKSDVWHVTRVDQEGQSYRLEGKVAGAEVTVSGEMTSANGDAGQIRGTRRKLADGRIEQQWESSSDGRSWTELWRGHYAPAGSAVTRAGSPAAARPASERATVSPNEPRAPAPATASPAQPTPTPPRSSAPAPPTPTAPAPAASAAAPPQPRVERSGAMEARSLEPPAPTPAEGDVAELSPRDRGPRRDPIRMASPMQLQFPIGPIEKLQDGYGWTSTDSGAYQVEEIRIEDVAVSRQKRRGQVEVKVELHVKAEGLSATGAATVELLDGDGAVVGSQETGRFPVGKTLTEQSQYGFVTKTVLFSLESERFDQLFAGARRPQLRITISAGKS